MNLRISPLGIYMGKMLWKEKNLSNHNNKGEKHLKWTLLIFLKDIKMTIFI